MVMYGHNDMLMTSIMVTGVCQMGDNAIAKESREEDILLRQDTDGIARLT